MAEKIVCDYGSAGMHAAHYRVWYPQPCDEPSRAIDACREHLGIPVAVGVDNLSVTDFHVEYVGRD